MSSRASIKFTVGAPEITPPHRREVRMTYSRFLPPNGGDGWGSVTRRKGVGRTKLVVVIEGDVPIADGLAMKIPEYVPFLILRRPPGGASAAAISSGFGSSYSMDVSVWKGMSIHSVLVQVLVRSLEDARFVCHGVHSES